MLFHLTPEDCLVLVSGSYTYYSGDLGWIISLCFDLSRAAGSCNNRASCCMNCLSRSKFSIDGKEHFSPSNYCLHFFESINSSRRRLPYSCLTLQSQPQWLSNRWTNLTSAMVNLDTFNSLVLFYSPSLNAQSWNWDRRWGGVGMPTFLSPLDLVAVPRLHRYFISDSSLWGTHS